MESWISTQLTSLYGINRPCLEAVTGEMYRCTTGTGCYYVRVTDYKSYEEQAAEIHFLRNLRQCGVGVASVVQSIQGQYLEQVHVEELKTMVVFEAAPGIHMPRVDWTADKLYKVGKEIGKLHRASQKYADEYPDSPIQHWHENKEYQFQESIPKEETHIRTLAKDVLKQIQMIPKHDCNYGIIHGDIWLENILMTDNKQVTFIDFQDLERHYYVYDLVVPFYSALEFSFIGKGNRLDYAKSIKSALLRGYEEEHELSQEMLAQWPLFYRLKELFEYSQLHKYWNQHRLTEEQVRIMNLYRHRLENGC